MEEKRYTNARYPDKINDLMDNDGNLNAEVIGTATKNKADLVGGKVPAEELPSYVDDVIECANVAAFPAVGEEGKIYVALDTGFTYRWGGTAYVQIGGQDLSNFMTLNTNQYDVTGEKTFKGVIYIDQTGGLEIYKAPVNDADAATKGYVDSVVNGLITEEF